MRATLTAAILFTILASSAAAQESSLGVRYSNYSTDLEVGFLSVDTSRASSAGLVGRLRAGSFVFAGQYDHDFAAGISPGFLPLRVGEFQRDRGELSVGWAALPQLDIEAGVRFDSFSVDSTFFSEFDIPDFDIDHQAFLIGANVHSATERPFGWYALLRGYTGSAETQTGFAFSSDTTGIRVEGAIRIPVGNSPLRVVPGVEYERIEMNDFDITLSTNRFFVNLEYSF
jgi:hypothetical protein